MAGLNRFLIGCRALCLTLVLVACGQPPSAVMTDGDGTGPVATEADTSAAVIDRPVQAEARTQTGPQTPAQSSVAAARPGKAQAVITDTRYGDWPLWSKNRQYSALENAQYHFGKHGPEFGARSYEDWVAKVHAFIHAPPPGTQTLRRKNGDLLMYDPKGNVFAVMTKQGAPRTMFRPDNGAAYWQAQKQIEAKRKLGRDPKGED